MKTWREAARVKIAAVVKANPSATGKELRMLISNAYPWGERRNHPYKAWCLAVQDFYAAQSHLVGSVTDYADTPLFSEVQS